MWAAPMSVLYAGTDTARMRQFGRSDLLSLAYAANGFASSLCAADDP